MPLSPHPQARELAEEIHSRPRPEVAAPATVSFLVVLGGEAEGREVSAAVAELCRLYGAPPPHRDRHHAAQLGGFELRWEQHTEFYTLTIIRPLPPEAAPFAARAVDLVPPGWLAAREGHLLAAVELALLGEPGEPDRAALARLFEGQPLVAARVGRGAATVWTALRPDAGGATRHLVWAPGLGPERAGRVVRRLLELEAYRMMALLGLPLARATSPRLRRLEERLAEIVSALRAGGVEAPGRILLEELLPLAAEVERMAAETGSRFAATRAYANLVRDRLGELGPERHGDLQPLGEFLTRRFEPAVRTCEAVGARLASLSARGARASDLARTRVNVDLEHQNQQLLASMERRARLQLRLQETVEGLSVAAISYYVVGLLSYVAAGGYRFGIGAEAGKALVGLATPLVVALVFLSTRLARRRSRAD